jgi:hypothetical protein
METSASSSVESAPAADAPSTQERPLEKLNASFSAQSDGASLHVYAALLGGGFLRVRGSDTLSANVNGALVPLVEQIETVNGVQKVHYVAEVSPPPDRPTVDIVFSRGGRSYPSSVKLLGDFQVKNAPETFRAGDRVKLELSPRPDLAKTAAGVTGPGIGIQVRGACLATPPGTSYQASSVTDAGGGTFVWDTSTLDVDPASEGCEVEVDVRLSTWGELAPELGSAAGVRTVEGLQHRTFRATLRR